ncbi:PEP-CTERM sorting domain-containing protein [Nostoc sp. CENA67]|uniref:PEP-CTERM sorting domain-containing protein n=1 Tax=Amazonocrinis nigriterrae CENA67 TaxID=2794033 RepID=A0A8J7HVB2_9NOST|nr:PEP-CTERM sorting domain-containing protein [Amazonocrinis nigriterrae]MBH8566502.1 PEP-CTERM sorting domain-containing protein [Amazonocrinis nigriterrae CENA67]
MTRFAVIDNLLTAFSGATLTRFRFNMKAASVPEPATILGLFTVASFDEGAKNLPLYTGLARLK